MAGFLTTWLCIFVLPVKGESVRSSVLLAASQISQGERLSLAPVVLARIYRVLKIISDSSSLELRGLTLPWQSLYAWIHLHIHGAFSCLECPSSFLERGYPSVIQLAQASSTFERERVRLLFFAPHLVIDRFSLIHQPEVVGLPLDMREVEIGLDKRGRYTLLHSMGVDHYG